MSYTPYGIALPRASEGKSWTSTFSGWPLGCHSRPPFLKLPTNSFFFVSTEIVGTPCTTQSVAVLLMCSNCAFRSGCCVPSTDLLGAWRLYSCARSNLATVLSLIRMPYSANISEDSTCVLLHVHRSGDSGSPRVTGSTSFSSAGHTSGCSTSYGLLPVLCRTLTTSSGRAPARTSSRPFLTVLMPMLVARATAATPPYPIASASAPAHNRRARSSMVGFNRRHFCPTNFSGDIAFVDHAFAILSIPLRASSCTKVDRLSHSRPLSLGEVAAARVEAPVQLVEEAGVEVHLLVPRTVEGPGRGARLAAAALGRVGEEDEL